MLQEFKHNHVFISNYMFTDLSKYQLLPLKHITVSFVLQNTSCRGQWSSDYHSLFFNHHGNIKNLNQPHWLHA